MGRDGSTRGQKKIQQLKDNSNYMRKSLIDMGCRVLGDYDSPVLVSSFHYFEKCFGLTTTLAKKKGLLSVALL